MIFKGNIFSSFRVWDPYLPYYFKQSYYGKEVEQLRLKYCIRTVTQNAKRVYSNCQIKGMSRIQAIELNSTPKCPNTQSLNHCWQLVNHVMDSL